MNPTTETRIECSLENAPKFYYWLKKRGGIAYWRSADLGNPSRTWSTPALTKDGQPFPKQHWSMQDKPEFIKTDLSCVDVIVDKEVARFHVAIRRGSGFSLVLTDASQRKLDKALSRAGKMATYKFDYDTQEAVILAPDQVKTLVQWAQDFPDRAQAALEGNF